MLKIINDLPGNVLGIEAEGEVTGANYEKVIIPAVDEKLKAYRKIRLLYYLGSAFSGFSVKAMIDDAEVGIKNFKAWDRVALVSEHKLINILAKYFGYLSPGKVRVFNNAGLDEAKIWISEL